MKTLLIDTCGGTGTVALAEDSEILASATLPGRTASERLVPAIRDLAARAGLALPSLHAIAVVHGPGSFTGVRVGLSAAKGLCHALDLPLVAISRLAVLAHLATPAAGARVHALFDAGRGEFYVGTYRDAVCLHESLLTHDQLVALLSLEPAPIVVCEPSVAESLGASSQLGSGGNAVPRLLAEPTAADALPLALRRIHQQHFDDLATLDANYLRRTDAEIFAKPRPSKASSAAPAPAATPGTPER
jgi:tRNA threonylcarbamoyladenosine biosynthesis protein TsaB